MRRWLPWLRLYAFTQCERDGEVEGRSVELRLGRGRLVVSIGRENWL